MPKCLRNQADDIEIYSRDAALPSTIQGDMHHSMSGSENEDIELAETTTHNSLRQRKKKKNDHIAPLASRPFAGRIGGNQEFTVDPDDVSFISIISKVPDAAANFSWHQSIGLQGFADLELWKEATIEGVGTCLQIYLAGLYAVGLAPLATATSLGPVTPAIIGAFANFILLTLFIYAGGPVSGKRIGQIV